MGDQIVYRANSQYTTKPLNIGDVKIYGLEHEFNFSLYNCVLQNKFCWMKSRIHDLDADREMYLNKERSYLPRFKDAASLEFKLFDRFTSKYTVNYRSGYYKTEYNLAVIPSSITHDACTGLLFLNGELRLMFEIYNILDHKNYDVEAFPLPGRAFYLTIYGNKSLSKHK